ncbi:MAG: DUF3047 domain-containing protein [Deltaproteobacteria bacterium]|nr:DUF3047 domain-containing protein [Deltaproteobacteria bacterium]
MMAARLLCLPILATALAAQGAIAAPPRLFEIDPHAFQLVRQESGPTNYYSVVESPDGAYIHGAYQPPEETAVLGYSFPEDQRRTVAKIRWRWRAVVLPERGDECVPERADSAATVYVTWKRGARWYSLKYVWSSVSPKGAVCDKKSNPLRVQETIIVESGAPLNRWKTVELDPDAEFRKHFEGGDPKAEVPDLSGIGIMVDGDQTQSPSEADFGSFAYQAR